MGHKTDAVRELPEWVVVRISNIVTACFMLSALAVGLVETFYSAMGTEHLLQEPDMIHMLWGQAMIGFAVIAILGEWFNRMRVSAFGLLGVAGAYMIFTLAGVVDHFERGMPELTLLIMTFTLGFMYLIMGTHRVSTAYYKE